METGFCALSDISTSPDTPLVKLDILDQWNLDCLEFAMGMSRGDSNELRGTSIMSETVHEDMADLFRKDGWALVPTPEILQTIYNTYTHNRVQSTRSRTQLLTHKDILVHGPTYTYEFLPIHSQDRRPIWVADVAHDYPYSTLPRIRSTIHPCFTIPLLSRYYTDHMDYSPSHLSWNSDMQDLVGFIMLQMDRPVNRSWAHGTWLDFPERGRFRLCRDPDAPKPKPRFHDYQESDSEYESDEERDMQHPRLLARRQRIVAYMEANNTRLDGTKGRPVVCGATKRKRGRESQSSIPSAKSLRVSFAERSTSMMPAVTPTSSATSSLSQDDGPTSPVSLHVSPPTSAVARSSPVTGSSPHISSSKELSRVKTGRLAKTPAPKQRVTKSSPMQSSESPTATNLFPSTSPRTDHAVVSSLLSPLDLSSPLTITPSGSPALSAASPVESHPVPPTAPRRSTRPRKPMRRGL